MAFPVLLSTVQLGILILLILQKEAATALSAQMGAAFVMAKEDIADAKWDAMIEVQVCGVTVFLDGIVLILFC